MGFKLAELYVDIRADSKRYESVVKGVQKATEKLHAGLERASKAARNMLLAGTGVAALAVRNAMQQEKANMQLDAALKTSGASLDRWSKRLQAFASEMQNATNNADDQVQSLMALGLNFGIQADQIESATRAAIGLSTALNMDLESAMKYTALAMNGEFTMLNRYIPALRATEDGTEKLAIMTRVANAGFTQAMAATTTLSGQMARIKNDFGDASEKLGFALIPILKKAAQQFVAFANMLNTMTDADVQAFVDKMINVGKVLVAIWLAPALISGVRGFIALLKGVEWAFMSVGGMAKSQARVMTAAVSAMVMAVTAMLAVISAQIMKIDSASFKLSLRSKTFAQLAQELKEARKEVKEAKTDDERLAALERQLQLQKQLHENEMENDAEQQDSEYTARQLGEMNQLVSPDLRSGPAYSNDLTRGTQDRADSRRSAINTFKGWADATEEEIKRLREKLGRGGSGSINAGLIPAMREAIELGVGDAEKNKQAEPKAAEEQETKAAISNRFVGLEEQYRLLSQAKPKEDESLNIQKKQLATQKQIVEKLDNINIPFTR